MFRLPPNFGALVKNIQASRAPGKPNIHALAQRMPHMGASGQALAGIRGNIAQAGMGGAMPHISPGFGHPSAPPGFNPGGGGFQPHNVDRMPMGLPFEHGPMGGGYPMGGDVMPLPPGVGSAHPFGPHVGGENPALDTGGSNIGDFGMVHPGLAKLIQLIMSSRHSATSGSAHGPY